MEEMKDIQENQLIQRTKKEEKRIQQERQLMERLRNIPPFHQWKPSDINCFFSCIITKKRGLLLMDLLHTLPFTHDTTYGSDWRMVYESFHQTIATIVDHTRVGQYNQMRMLHHRGEPVLDLYFLQDGVMVTKRILSYESSIEKISPMLTVPVHKLHCGIESYDSFYYQYYLDCYMELDEGITERKPSIHEFCIQSRNHVTPHPFFNQLRERSHEHYLDKKRNIHTSIYDYLQQYSESCPVELIATMFLESQKDKLYIEWKQDYFEVEQILFSINEFHFSHIQHRNTLVFHTNRFSILFHLHWYGMSCPIEPVWTISVKKRKTLLL
jgi:hypothetical protein